MANHRIISVLLAISGAALSGCQFMPGFSDPAMEEFVRGDYIRAYAKLETRARLGDTSAQYAVGYMNYYGLGVAENRDLALNWFRVSARYGYQPAQQAIRILTHREYKAAVNPSVSKAVPAQTVSMMQPVEWIRNQQPTDYTIEVKEPQLAASLQEKNYPLVSYRYKDQDQIEQAWIYGDFKTAEQAKAIQQALMRERLPTADPHYFLQAGLADLDSPMLEKVCLNTASAETTSGNAMMVGPFETLEEAQVYQQYLPVQTQLRTYTPTQPVKVALKSMQDIQLAMLP